MTKPKLPIGSRICRCVGCDQYFASPSAFTAHRKQFACLTPRQMREKGMIKNERQQWTLGKKIEIQGR